MEKTCVYFTKFYVITTLLFLLSIITFGQTDSTIVFRRVELKVGNKVRNESGPIGKIVGSIPPGETVELIDMDSSDYWLIRYGDNKVGYVSDIYIEYTDEIKELSDSFKIRNKNSQLVKRKIDLINKYGVSVGLKIYNGEYWIGMSDVMAKESLGYPDDINKSVGSWGVHEQWVYKELYLYFENGTLTSYQN